MFCSFDLCSGVFVYICDVLRAFQALLCFVAATELRFETALVSVVATTGNEDV